MNPIFGQEFNPSLARTSFQEGLGYLAENQTIRAMSAFKAAILADQALFQAYYQLGLIYVQLAEYSKALHCFSQVLEQNPRDVATLKARGNVYLVNGERKKAEADYFQVSQIEPDKEQELFEKFDYQCWEKTDTERIMLDLKLDLEKQKLERRLETQRKELLQKKFETKKIAKITEKIEIEKEKTRCLRVKPMDVSKSMALNNCNDSQIIDLRNVNFDSSQEKSSQGKEVTQKVADTKLNLLQICKIPLKTLTTPEFFWKKIIIEMALVVAFLVGFLFWKNSFPYPEPFQENHNSKSLFSKKNKEEVYWEKSVSLLRSKSPQVQKTLKSLVQFELLPSLKLKEQLAEKLSLDTLLAILAKPSFEKFHVQVLEAIALRDVALRYQNRTEFLIEPYLDGKNERALAAAITIAGFLPSKSNQLFSIFESNASLPIRIQALKAASRTSPKTLLPLLLYYAKNSKPRNREERQITQAAIHGLRFYSEPDAIDTLIHKLSSPSESMAKEAIESLSKQRNLIPKKFLLLKELAVKEERLKRNIYKVISEQNDIQYISFLEKGLQDKNDSIKYLSLKGLCRIPSKKILQIIGEQMLSEKVQKKHKFMILAELSDKVILKIKENSVKNGKSEVEPLFLEICQQLQEPDVKLAGIKKIITTQAEFDPRILLDLLEPQFLKQSKKLSLLELGHCRIQAWQLLIQITKQHLPLEKKVWAEYFSERNN